DQPDQPDEDEHHHAEAALPRKLQDLVLDEPRKPHTVSPPVTSRNPSSSEARDRSTAKTSTPAAVSARRASGTLAFGIRASIVPSPSTPAPSPAISAAPNGSRTSRAWRAGRTVSRRRSDATRSTSSRTGPLAS